MIQMLEILGGKNNTESSTTLLFLCL